MQAKPDHEAKFRYPVRSLVIKPARPHIIAILAISALLIALVWAGAIHSIRQHGERALQSAVRENRNRSIAFEHFVANTFDEADAAARYFATRNAGLPRNAPPALPRQTTELLSANPLFIGIEVADAHGNVRATSRDAKGPVNVSQTDAFRTFAVDPTRTATFVSDPAPLFGDGPSVLGISRPIRAQDGAFGGIVTVYIPVTRLTDFFHGVDFRPLDLMSVIRLDGLTLARREGQTVSSGQKLAGTRVMQEQLAHPDGTYTGPSAVDGVERIFSHRRIERYDMFVTVGVGTEDVFALTRERMHVFYALVGALSATILLCAALICLNLYRGERRMRHLAATNERLREAQRIGRMGDWEYNVATGMLICSDEVLLMHGRDPKQDILSGEEALSYHKEESRIEIERTLRLTIKSREPQWCEVVSPLALNREAYLRIRMAPVVDPDGMVRTVLGTEQDVTSEKLHDQLRTEVSHMARVEAVNLMAATIAHELSQPLTAASNFLSAASHVATAGAGRDHDTIARLLTQAKRQIGLASTIIGRAREMISDSRQSEVASLDEIVDDAIALSRAANPEGGRVSLVAEILPDTGHVAADKVQIQQVLLNLIRNAVEAVAAPGGPAHPRVVVSSRRAEGGMVMVCVSDNGPGLPADRDIFSPFGSSKQEGLGIGLSICRTIIDSYGGRIWNEDGPAGGAAVCFTLPLDELAMLYEIA